MNLGGVHRIHGKVIHNHRLIDSYRFYTCHDYRWNAWKGSLGIVFCADDKACYVINQGIISPQICSIAFNQLLTGFD